MKFSAIVPAGMKVTPLTSSGPRRRRRRVRRRRRIFRRGTNT